MIGLLPQELREMRFQMSSREQLAVDMSEAGQSSKARRVCVCVCAVAKGSLPA